MQISKEEREQVFKEYITYLKDKAARKKAAEDGEEGSGDKHKVLRQQSLCLILVSAQLILEFAVVHNDVLGSCQQFDGVGCTQKKRHKEKKDKRDRDGGEDDEKRHKRSKR